MRWATLAALLVLTGGYFGFHALFVKVGRSVQQPFAGPASRNPFYVLQRYLEERGLEVRTVHSWPEQITPDTAVFWLSFEPVPKHVRSWLAAGGQLWSLRDPDSSAEPAGWSYSPWPGEEEEPEPLESNETVDGDAGTDLQPAAEPAQDEEELEDEDAEQDEDEDEGLAGDWCKDGCLHAAQFRYGRGYLTLVRRFSLLNEAVSAGDTPARLDALLNRAQRPKTVLIITSFASPWFGELLLQHAREALLALAALLTLWLWRAGKHFGPTLPAPARERRQMLEHVSAVGMLAGRVGAAPLLLAARRELRRRLMKRDPHATGLQGAALVAAVAAATDIPSEQVQRALLDDPSGSGRDTLAIARAIQALWRKS